MEIKKYTLTDTKIKALIYGASGSGKTRFGGTAENAIFASAENGLMSIVDKKPDYIEIKSMKDLQELYFYLKKGEHKYKTIVIDSITEINEIIKIEIEKKSGHNMNIQDWGILSKKLRSLLMGFRGLPINVIFIAQEKYITDEDRIKKIVPALNGKSATDIAYFMDVVGYLHIKKDGETAIETDPNSSLLTKDRSGLIGNNTEPDFEVWIKKISTVKTEKEKIVFVSKDVSIEAKKQQQETKQEDKRNQKRLIEELEKSGAKTDDEKIVTINNICGTEIESLDLSEQDSKIILMTILKNNIKQNNEKDKKPVEKIEKKDTK